jgi:glycolate oxidase iron-sulfur subunit
VAQGIEAIVITASGCGVLVKDYGELLKHDPGYATKAQRIAQLAKDIGEVLDQEELPKDRLKPTHQAVAFHSPCTLQHGQKLNGIVESILSRAGFALTTVPDPHLCCGSAGTYSILQPQLARELLDNKLGALQSGTPSIIATANIGCQLHLATKAACPVKHWIELLDEVLY